MQTRTRTAALAKTDWLLSLDLDCLDHVLNHLRVDELLPLRVVSNAMETTTSEHHGARFDMFQNKLPQQIIERSEAKIDEMWGSRYTRHETRSFSKFLDMTLRARENPTALLNICKKMGHFRLEHVGRHSFIRYMESESGSKLDEYRDELDTAQRECDSQYVTYLTFMNGILDEFTNIEMALASERGRIEVIQQVDLLVHAKYRRDQAKVKYESEERKLVKIVMPTRIG